MQTIIWKAGAFLLAATKRDASPNNGAELFIRYGELIEDLVAAGLNAINIARDDAKEIQGGGGGQPFFASVGGKNAAGIEKAIAKALEAMK